MAVRDQFAVEPPILHFVGVLSRKKRFPHSQSDLPTGREMGSAPSTVLSLWCGRDWKGGRIDSFNMHTCGNAMHCWFVGKDACTSSGITLHHVHGTFMKFLPGLAGQVLLGQKAPCSAEPDVYLLLNISAQPWRQHGVVATATSGLTRHQGQMTKKMRRAIKHDKKY